MGVSLISKVVGVDFYFLSALGSVNCYHFSEGILIGFQKTVGPHSLPETNSSPLKIGLPKKKVISNQSSNHHFVRGKLLVLGCIFQECNPYNSQLYRKHQSPQAIWRILEDYLEDHPRTVGYVVTNHGPWLVSQCPKDRVGLDLFQMAYIFMAINWGLDPITYLHCGPVLGSHPSK